LHFIHTKIQCFVSPTPPVIPFRLFLLLGFDSLHPIDDIQSLPLPLVPSRQTWIRSINVDIDININIVEYRYRCCCYRTSFLPHRESWFVVLLFLLLPLLLLDLATKRRKKELELEPC
jgi:hypothetical protein